MCICHITDQKHFPLAALPHQGKDNQRADCLRLIVLAVNVGMVAGNASAAMCLRARCDCKAGGCGEGGWEVDKFIQKGRKIAAIKVCKVPTTELSCRS